MDIIYLFVIYQNADFVYHTCQRLVADNVFFYVHVDIKSKENFEKLRKIPHLSFSAKRYSAEWAGPGLVYATLYCLSEIVERHKNGHVVLMSESDYPVKTAEYINHYLTNNADRDFIKITPLPAMNPLDTPKSYWLEGGTRKIKCYALRLTGRMIATIEPRRMNWGNIRQFIKVFLYKRTKMLEALRLLCAPRRTHPDGIVYGGGDLWFILRLSTIRKILEYLRKDSKLINDARYVESVDEIFFQSLVGSLVRKDEIVHSTLRFVNWPSGKVSSPEYIRMEDSKLIDENISNPDILFIRKVRDIAVAEYIDKNISIS